MSVGAMMLQNQGARTKGGQPERRAMRDWVLMKLYEGIFSGTYAPGTSFSESDLSESLGVSRQPIREALRELEGDGLISSVAGNGARSVTAFNRNHVIELYSLRAALEPVSFRFAAPQISEEQIAELTELQLQLEARVSEDAPTPGAYNAGPDYRFHQIVAEASGMPQLNAFLVKLWLKTWALLTQLDMAGTYPNKSEMRGSYVDRRELLDALVARDADRAAAAAAQHVQHRMDDLLAAIDSGRGTFHFA
jgi:DNA-binding GntR family transcriptional regulator